MHRFARVVCYTLPLLSLIVLVGCGDPSTDASTKDSSGESHDHHDHDGHDEHDHDGHDHDGHDHGDHSHGESKVIDANAEGLDADELVTLEMPKLPESYGDAVDQLVTLSDTIRDGMKSDDIETAHDPLHDVGHILESIELLVDQSSFTDEQKKSISDAVETLFDSYGAIDEGFHGEEGKKFDEVEADIDDAVKTLVDIKQQQEGES